MRLSALLAIFVCCATAFAQEGALQTRTPISVQQYPAIPVMTPNTADRAASTRIAEPMPFVAPLVFETSELTNTLVLANAASVPTTATIHLFSQDGTLNSHETISLRPHEKREYPITSSLENMTLPRRWASVVVDQDPKAGMGVVVAGQVIVTDRRSSTPAYIDEELAMPEMEGSTTLSAVADQSEGPPMVAVTNVSALAQHVTLTCMQNAQHPVQIRLEIAGHATALSKACSSTSVSTLPEYTSSLEEHEHSEVYGFKVDGTGDPGSLAAFALAPHYRGRDLVFSSVPFYDPGTIHSSDVVFAGVPIGAQETLPAGVYTPRLSLANFSNVPLAFFVSLADTITSPAKDAEGNVHSPLMNTIHQGTIPPHQVGEYIFNGQEAQSGLLHSIVVSTKASPGSYQAKLVSRSTGALYEVELLAKETLEMKNAGVHPWTTQGDTESHIVLFNHSNADKKVGVFINAGSTLWSHEMILAPSETSEISINKIREEQVPDDRGRRLPLGIFEGVVDWMTPESGDVTGRLMVTSRDAAMARNYSCGTYKSECNLSFATFYNDITPGEALEMYEADAEICINSQPLQCSNAETTSGTVNYNWNVGATSIISLNTSSQQTVAGPMLKGVSIGSGVAKVTASAGQCQSSGSGTPKVQAPTIVVNTTGSKTAGDKQLFADDDTTCSESLGYRKCSTVWDWNIEYHAVVPDDASLWKITQAVTSERAAGKEKNSAGALVSFDTGVASIPSDGPPYDLTQQPAGTKDVFFIDSPGHNITDSGNGDTYDSFTQVQNFADTLCSTQSGLCYTYFFYLKLVVKSGGTIDTVNSTTGVGTTSTSF